MALIRLIHASSLPTPGDLVKRIEEQGGPAAMAPAPRPAMGNGGGNGSRGHAASAIASGAPIGAQSGAGSGVQGGATTNALAMAPQAQAQPAPASLLIPDPQNFEALVAAVAKMREGMLHGHLLSDVHLVHYEPGRIEFRPGPGAPANLANRLGQLMSERTGRRWVVAISREAGQPTLREQTQAEDLRQRREASSHPLVQAVLKSFPGAAIEAIRQLKPEPVAAPAAPDDMADDIGEELTISPEEPPID
jgi:DNA polymerase-3 subunit gamma/tau